MGDPISFTLRITLWAIVIVLVLMAERAWRKHHKAGRGSYVHSQKENQILVSNALKALNCQCKWEKEQGGKIAKFDFQTGHFRLRIEDGSPYVRLSYLFVFDAPLVDIELVRNVCNQCNINSENIRVVYSINEENNVVDVHILSGLLLADSTAKDVLSHAMLDMFRWQNAFFRRFHDLQDSNANAEGRDLEKDHAMYQRELFLVREQEIMHQSVGPEWRQDVSKVMSLKQVLSTTLGLNDIIPIRMAVVKEDVQEITDTASTLNYDLSSLLIEKGQFVRENAGIRLFFFNARQPEKERQLNISLCSEKGTEDSLYYRITMTVIPLSIQRIIPAGSNENRQEMCSILVAYDLKSNKKQLDEFHYMWKEAMAIRRGKENEKMSDEQRLICDCLDPQEGYHLYRGRALYQQKRFYEALFHLENAFSAMEKRFDTMKGSQESKFYETCYLIGSCYCELGQYKRAYYYLQMTLSLNRITFTEEFINCLVNSGDHRAIKTIDNYFNEVELSLDLEEKSEPGEHIVHFLDFLKRRKAYALVSRHRFDEAEELLKAMLDDPGNSDFAINELAYIQKIKDNG